MPQQEVYAQIAEDLARWLEDMSDQLAIALSPQGIAPFAAPISEQQKLAYYSSQLFNQDGTPNEQGRNAELQRLGPIGFRTVYRAVIQAYPWLKLPAPPEGAAPEVLGPTPGIPAMASGGIVTQPTLALIGEAGPEMVVPLSGDMSGPAATLQQSDPANPQPGEIQNYIDQAARQRGIDPTAAMAVAYHEGGRDPMKPDQPAFTDPAVRGTFNTGSSWWPFQLHYGGPGYEQYGTVAGMGNDFTAQTGYQPGDPAAWKPSVDYALDQALKYGWSRWYGSKPAGVAQWQGIPGH